MLRLCLRNDLPDAGKLIQGTHGIVKSAHYYRDYNKWLVNKFIPSWESGNSTILTAHCKVYNGLVGFALLKHDKEEVKISNLSPLIDGVGVTQALLDAADFTLDKDYSINIPMDATALIDRVKQLKFELLGKTCSKDQTEQLTFIKQRNLKWL